jgi:hypothetical protein
MGCLEAGASIAQFQFDPTRLVEAANRCGCRSVVVVLAALAAATIVILIFVIAVSAMVVLTDPRFMNEVDRLPASGISSAVARPVLLMRRRDVHVDRLLVDRHRTGSHDDRLLVHDGRWQCVADVDAAICPRLIDANRDAGASVGECGR